MPHPPRSLDAARSRTRDSGKNKRNKNKRSNRAKPGQPSMADKADRHALYEDAVQCAEAEIDFIDETFTKVRKRKAILLREDFAGTANTSCEWVRRRSSNRAIAVDLDSEVQEWGRERHVSKLGAASDHVQIVNADVMEVDAGPVDILIAHNFSYWLFKERHLLMKYFKCVRNTLRADGLFFMDAYGGYDAHRTIEEATEHDDFTYVWDQAAFNPVNQHMLCHIHFHFPDGSKLKRAFTYTWRLWSIPEIREILADAGFSRSTVYWQGWDEDADEDDDEADGEFYATEEGEPDAGWIAYIVAEP